MIPKIIHYVWVGGQPKPKDIQRCMETWKKHLKGYQIKEWNESNFDIDAHPFTKQAYKEKSGLMSAIIFVHNQLYIMKVARIYLDTDVLVLDDLSQFLDNRAFVGFDN